MPKCNAQTAVGLCATLFRFSHRLSIPGPRRGLGERHVVVGFFAAGDESAKSRRATRARRRIKKGSFEPSFQATPSPGDLALEGNLVVFRAKRVYAGRGPGGLVCSY